MLEDKDIKKLIRAMEEVFPTATMVKNSFDTVATKEQVESLTKKVEKIDVRLENIEDLRPRVKAIEESLEM